MRRALAVLLATACLLAALVAGCGKDDAARPSATAKADLQAQTRQVRSAATANDRSGAEAALARFRTSVNRLQGEGQLAREDAERLLALAARVESALDLLPGPPPAPSTTQVVPQRPREAEGDQGEDDADNRGQGRGKGQGKGDD